MITQGNGKMAWLAALLGVWLLAHLPALTQPPLDEHCWRQTDTAGVARNFAEESADIRYPRIDMRMQHTGVTGMEFPAFNYLLFLLNLLLGFAHWHGRLLSLVLGTVGLLFLFGLTRREFGFKAALFSVATLATSRLFFYYARNIQPDVTMVSSAIGCLYFISRYKETSAWRDYVASVSLLSLACLIKIPAAVTLLPWVLILGRQRVLGLLRPGPVLVLALVGVAPAVGWYLHAEHLNTAYGLGQYFYGKLGVSETLEFLKIGGFWRQLFFAAFAPKPISLPITVLSVLGVVVLARRGEWWVPGWLAAVFFFLIVFANKSYAHNYYALPQTPALAVMTGVGAAFAWDWLSQRHKALPVAMVVVLAGSMVGNLLVRVLPAYELLDAEFVRLEAVADATIPRQDLIVTNLDGAPVMLYFAHRKGWSVPTSEILDPARVAQLRSQGARHILMRIPNGTTPPSITGAELAYSDASFAVYHLP